MIQELGIKRLKADFKPSAVKTHEPALGKVIGRFLPAIDGGRRSFKEIANLLDRTVSGLRRTRIVSLDGSGYFCYVNSYGDKIHLPVTTSKRTGSYEISERDYQYMKSDHEHRCTALSWEDVQDRMAKQNIDLLSAQLKCPLQHKLTEVDNLTYFTYISPGGSKTQVRVYKLGQLRGAGTVWCFYPEDVDTLISLIKKDQQTYVTSAEAMDRMDFKGKGNLDGRTFSLDGKRWELRIYRTRASAVTYMRRDQVKAYSEWLRLYKERSTEYIAIKDKICSAKSEANREIEYKRFLSNLETVNGELIVRLSSAYGLALRIREIDGVYYVKKEHAGVLRFFLSITHPLSRVKTNAITRLLSEARDCTAANPFLMTKLWTARDIFVNSSHVVSARAVRFIKNLESLLNDESVLSLFKRYDLTRLERRITVGRLDLRYYLAKNEDWNHIIAMANRSKNDNDPTAYALK